ncbi:hypothetical protein DOP62_13975 (plasmid) [Synechococcus elongatus PCC 11801]|uniref:Uncharacterized protein n=1 Tax=Synechococcus elongatus PCC 11801 TaxID=2219813 RepID=A0ACD5A2T9_SYNEL
MYDHDGHFDPMDNYFTEEENYWPDASEDPTLDQRPAPTQKQETTQMAQAVSLASGTVKFLPREPRDYGYGPRISALIVSDTGEEVRVYGNDGDPVLLNLQKGQRVQMVKVKNTWTIAEALPQTEASHTPAAEEAQAAPAPSSIGREAQAAHAPKTPEELANIWADAFKELRTQLPDAPPEILGPAATSILINLAGSKRF